MTNDYHNAPDTLFLGQERVEQDTVHECQSHYTQSSIIGNWLRTKATSVEVVDMSGSYAPKIPDYAFYGCSIGNQGNSSLKRSM